MRSKHSSRTRTRTHSREQRLHQSAWANRYDYLNTSPPPPPQSSSPVPSSTSSSTPGVSSEQQARALSLELFGANAKATEKRDWADDDVPSTLFSPGRFPLVLDVATGSTPARKEILKQPHNASVFVGSLPPHKDEAELAQLLAQHLSRYAKVQNIKIVRDSKGGLCAFVQCEDATQAAQLVTQAQANPQSFMGRYLRYENARARRTLWISYRTPMYFMPCSSQDEEGPDIVTDETGVKGRWIESDLPDALRIWKPRDVKYPIVTFRGEARNIGDVSRSDKDALTPNVPAAFRQKGVLFTELKFDAQTIQRMAEAFGPLDSFKALSANESGGHSFTYPLGHDANRSVGMDTGIWEIKWEHRDDCITALNTLRRIPHLTVTWAKDLHTSGSNFIRTPTSPRYPASHPQRDVISPIVRGRPFLLLDRNSNRENAFRSTDVSSSTQTSGHSSKLASPQKGAVRLGPLVTRRGNEAIHDTPEGEEIDEGWTFVGSHYAIRTVPPALSERALPVAEGIREKVREWSEGDFPPLKTDVRSIGIKKSDEESIPVTTSIPLDGPALQFPRVEQSEASMHEEINSDEETLKDSRPVIVHRRSLSNPVARLQAEISQASPGAQRLEIPPTPDLANSSLTQTPTSGHPELQSPAHPAMIPLPAPGCDEEQKKLQEGSQESEGIPSESDQGSMAGGAYGRRDHRRQMTVDPKTVFVGGLEAYGPRPWDESRLREIFGKYGQVHEVHIVCPGKKAGFAFVTFSDEESAAKAISGEHNHFYDGRQIRVQIRDMNPPRGFKFRGRGFGRRPFGFGSHFDGMHRHANTMRPTEPNYLAAINQNKPFGHHLVYASGPQERVPFQANLHGPQSSHQLAPSTSMETDSTTLRSLNSFDSKIDTEAFQETDSKTAVSNTPPPGMSSLSASTSGPFAPVTPQGLPAAPVNYYSPHAWPSPCGVQMHYPMPYGAYGGMIPTMPLPFASANQTTDPSTVSGTSSAQWNPMYRTSIPFTPYPYIVVPPANTDVSRSATVTSSQPTTPVKSQPPLHPTGFIQGEHGVLIPMYQPEALSDYMSGCSPTQNATAPRASTMSAGAAFVGQQQSNLSSVQMWHGYTHAPQFIAYPVPPASSVGVTTSATPPGLVQHHASPQHMLGQPLQVSASHPGSYATTSVGNATHTVPVHQSIISSRPSGSTVHGMPPPYFVGHHPSAMNMPSASHRGGFHLGHATHGAAAERNNVTYVNKHLQRRDPAFYHNRSGQSTHGRGPEFTTIRSPSTSRSAGGFSNTSRADYSQSNNSFHQRQRSSSTAPSHQLGFTKHIQDGGQSQQQHQWTGSIQQ
ncbi:hypothetical protein ACEPAH_952 [Sanghuangporus vaninii]